jgi:hypothetical protein
MRDVSTIRLYVLRAAYLLVAVGLATMIWPLIIDPPRDLQHMRGVVWSMLTAVSLLAILGIRYPLKMIPLLLFELTWKLVWIVVIGLPLWMGDRFDPATRGTWNDNLFGLVLMPLVIPWGYVWRTYVKAPSDRWRSGSQRATSTGRAATS